jgi:hypothetical protein
LELRRDQLERLEQATARRQLWRIVQEYAGEIEPVDPALAQRLRGLDESWCDEHFRKIYDLTPDRLYQRALLAITVDTGTDVFAHPEFEYILGHRFLTGTAKARHIVESVVAISAAQPRGARQPSAGAAGRS